MINQQRSLLLRFAEIKVTIQPNERVNTTFLIRPTRIHQQTACSKGKTSSCWFVVGGTEYSQQPTALCLFAGSAVATNPNSARLCRWLSVWRFVFRA